MPTIMILMTRPKPPCVRLRSVGLRHRAGAAGCTGVTNSQCSGDPLPADPAPGFAKKKTRVGKTNAFQVIALTPLSGGPTVTEYPSRC